MMAMFTNLEILISKYNKRTPREVVERLAATCGHRMYSQLCRSSSGRHVWVLCRGRLPSPRAWHRWCQRSLPPQLHASGTSCPGPSSHLNTGAQRDLKKKKKNLEMVCVCVCVCVCVLSSVLFLQTQMETFLHECDGRTHVSHTGHVVTDSHAPGVLPSTQNTTFILSTIIFLSSLPLPGGEVSARPSPHLCNV